MRSKKALYNSIFELTLQAVTVICGLILPRLILSHFGSAYNGITSSINQFISYVSLLTAGIGGVTKAALYKPLVDKDNEKISGILLATELFMRKVALIFAAGLLVFAAIYPVFVRDDFDWFFTFTLVLILGLGTFAQYYFGNTYKMLLQADQRGYVSALIQIITVILNTVIASILIVMGCSIHVVRLGSAFVYVLNPIAIHLYVRNRYKVTRGVRPDNSAIKQRWDAFAHNVAGFVHDNTDIVLLTVFTNLREVSVYAVYSMIIRSVQTLVRNFSGGIEGAFGNMLAKNEDAAIEKNLRLFEFINYSLSSIFSSCTLLLILPFVSIYTRGITDADYSRPLFAYILCAAEYVFTARKPYQSLINAAGHYRQTRNGAILEAALNVGISVALVSQLGLVGVAIGTLCAMIFRTVQYAVYASKHIVKRSLWVFAGRFLSSIANILITVVIVRLLPSPEVNSYLSWVLAALSVFAVSVTVTALFTAIFYREDFLRACGIMKNIIKKKVI